METKKCPPCSKWLNGFLMPDVFSTERFQSAIDYKPKDNDLFIVTYAKCGTTWTQHIVSLIHKRGNPITSYIQFSIENPFLEFVGTDALEDMPKGEGAIKVHLPFHLTPWSEKARYIYVTRNPKDCCVSYYHHMKDFMFYKGTFDEFFELFIAGEVPYGDYFDHLLGWYERRNDPNVLFVSYEEMKENPVESVLKIATHMGKKYAEMLKKDPKIIDKIIYYSSFDYMKESVNKGFEDMFHIDDEKIQALPESHKRYCAKLKELVKKKPEPIAEKINFIRKGIIGDWRNYFSAEQNKRMDEKISHLIKDTQMYAIWKKYI